MHTKFLAILSILMVMGSGPLAAKDSGDGPAVLRTLDGRVFQVTELVKVDPNGLLFRHRKGIAKVTFDQLDAGIRKEFAYDAAEAKEFEAARKERPSPAGDRTVPAAQSAGESEWILEVTSITRALAPGPAFPFCAGAYGLPFAAYPFAPWGSHWSRYQPAHILAHYPYRHWAEHELLHRSGFLPWQKRGVVFRD